MWPRTSLSFAVAYSICVSLARHCFIRYLHAKIHTTASPPSKLKAPWVAAGRTRLVSLRCHTCLIPLGQERLTLSGIPLHAVLSGQLSKVGLEDGLVGAVRQQGSVGACPHILLPLAHQDIIEGRGSLADADDGRGSQRGEECTARESLEVNHIARAGFDDLRNSEKKE